MSSNYSPWYKKVNDYLDFEEREQFLRGAFGFRPNIKFEAIMSNLSSGYVNNKFEKAQPIGKRNVSQQRH